MGTPLYEEPHPTVTITAAIVSDGQDLPPPLCCSLVSRFSRGHVKGIAFGAGSTAPKILAVWACERHK